MSQEKGSRGVQEPLLPLESVNEKKFRETLAEKFSYVNNIGSGSV
jgi:hypothetical protein